MLCYECAAKRLDVLPAGCLVVEDSATGVAAGKAAGMRVCACVRPGSACCQDPTPAAVAAYNEKITSKLGPHDSLVGDLSHFEFVKFGLFRVSK
jgi:beta-phosphoglucomutase-like phosphatase (HAD superfamily)